MQIQILYGLLLFRATHNDVMRASSQRSSLKISISPSTDSAHHRHKPKVNDDGENEIWELVSPRLQ